MSLVITPLCRVADHAECQGSDLFCECMCHWRGDAERVLP